MYYMDERKSLVMAALQRVPLDRMRLTKTLFLVWYSSGRPSNFPFQFRPYLYGPFSDDLYPTLAALQSDGLIAPEPDIDERWAKLYLTEMGERQALMLSIDASLEESIHTFAEWASEQSFSDVLRYVYSEAPEFATKSIARL